MYYVPSYSLALKFQPCRVDVLRVTGRAPWRWVVSGVCQLDQQQNTVWVVRLSRELARLNRVSRRWPRPPSSLVWDLVGTSPDTWRIHYVVPMAGWRKRQIGYKWVATTYSIIKFHNLQVHRVTMIVWFHWKLVRWRLTVHPVVVDDLSDFSKGQAFECFLCDKQVHIVIACCVYCLFIISFYFCFRSCLLYIFCTYVFFFFWCYHFGE